MKLTLINVLLLSQNKLLFMQIDYIQHSSIDKNKWDQAILAAGNGLLYACSWYLDCIAPDWDALVANDYEYVFPVTVKHKYKLPYIVQPFLAQQLGLFSARKISESVLRKFIAKLPSFSYEINLNYNNPLPEGLAMPNLILDISKNYESIRNTYSKNTRRNIAKAHQYVYSYVEIDSDLFIKKYHTSEHRDKKVNQSLIGKVVKEGFDRGYIRCSAVVAPDGTYDALLAYGVFNQRISYLFPVSSERGKQQSAMFMLVDELIIKYAGTNNIFDFEGSMIEGIARFYRGFGANEQPYRIIKQLRPSFLIGKI